MKPVLSCRKIRKTNLPSIDITHAVDVVVVVKRFPDKIFRFHVFRTELLHEAVQFPGSGEGKLPVLHPQMLIIIVDGQIPGFVTKQECRESEII